MKYKTETGWTFDTEGPLGFAKSATEYAHQKGLEDIIVVMATSADGEEKEYVILKDNVPVNSSQRYEEICSWIDMCAISEHFEREQGEADKELS